MTNNQKAAAVKKFFAHIHERMTEPSTAFTLSVIYDTKDYATVIRKMCDKMWEEVTDFPSCKDVYIKGYIDSPLNSTSLAVMSLAFERAVDKQAAKIVEETA